MKILIIRPAALGDTLMLMPAIAQLRASAELVLVARHPGLDYIRPHVDHAIDYEGPGWHRLFLEKVLEDHAPAIPEVDCVVAFLSDPGGSVRENLRTLFSTASVHLFPAFPPKTAKIHVALYLAQCLQKAGLHIDPANCLEEACRRPLLGTGSARQDRLVFHPGSGGKSKNYPPEFWLELMRRFRGEIPPNLPLQKFLLLLGPAEDEFHSFYTANLGDKVAEIVFCPEKQELLSLLEKACLYIGHDSGITHLAAMIGTPTIALFKHSPVHQWRPLGPYVRIIEGQEYGAGLEVGILESAKALLSRSVDE